MSASPLSTTPAVPAMSSLTLGGSSRETIHIAVPPDPLRRAEVIRIAMTPRATAPGIAPIVAAYVVDDGVVVEQRIPRDARRLGSAADLDRLAALTLLATLAASLAALHGVGHAHGRVRWDSIRRRPSGEVLLVGWAPDGSATEDVADLARLAVELLPAGSVRADVAALLVRARDPEARLRPPMSRLAEAFAMAGAQSRPGAAALRPPASRGVTRRSPWADREAAGPGAVRSGLFAVDGRRGRHAAVASSPVDRLVARLSAFGVARAAIAGAATVVLGVLALRVVA